MLSQAAITYTYKEVRTQRANKGIRQYSNLLQQYSSNLARARGCQGAPTIIVNSHSIRALTYG